MNAKARAARLIVKARRNEAKAHAQGLHTTTSHALRAGVAAEDAAGVGNAVRAKGKVLGITGTPAIMFRRTADGIRPVRGAKRFTVAQFRLLATAYNPRATKYVAARETILSYTAR